MAEVLLAGESWISATIDHKGYDPFHHTQIEIGCTRLIQVLAARGHEITHLRSHDVAEHFPQTLDALQQFDVVLLSDVGANTLLLHPDTFDRGRPTPNRLKLLKTWVCDHGGGLMMVGGYLSFQGFEGKANYVNTPVEDILPVDLEATDDRVETPEGVNARLVNSEHPVCRNLDTNWPILLGYQRVHLKSDAKQLATVNGDVMLAVRDAGAGRTLAFTSDISSHWAPQEFLDWEGYSTLFGQSIEWLAEQSANT